MVAEKPRDILRRDWYSGTIRLPQGKLLNYVHGGYGSTYVSSPVKQTLKN